LVDQGRAGIIDPGYGIWNVSRAIPAEDVGTVFSESRDSRLAVREKSVADHLAARDGPTRESGDTV
jgi:hypothetical protein